MDFDETRLDAVRSRRSIFLIALTTFALSFSALGIAPARAADTEPPADSWQAAAEEASATPAELRSEVSDGSLKLVIVRDVGGSPVIETAHVTSRIELDQKLADLRADPSVLAVDESKVFHVSSTIDAASPENQWALSAISASESVSGGSGVVVAVVDTGVDANHPDLQGQVLPGEDFVDGAKESTNSCVLKSDSLVGQNDSNGHGTFVAGIIAARGLFVQGVASGVKILPIRALDLNGIGSNFNVACGIIYAVNHGADIINLSLGTTERDATTAAAISYAHQQGVVVIAAAGNNADACNKFIRNIPNYPAAEPNSSVVGVAAIEPDGTRARYSTWGPQVDIAAPGSSITSTFTNNAYGVASGTSMAAPHVAAVAALVLEKNPDLTPDEIYARLISSAFNPLGAYSESLGHGVVNARAALQGVRATSQEVFSGTKPANLSMPACILSEIEQQAREKAAAEEAARVAAEQAEAARVAASLPVVRKSLSVRALSKKRVSVAVAAPPGSRTFIQRKVGKKWRTVVSTTAVPSMVVKVTRAGTYRVRVEIPSGTITSKTVRVR